jgi:ABC-type uncharacterized transport system involved in gliding motility auxiliary subunit
LKLSPLRRWWIALSVLLSVAAVLALVAMANYLGSRHFVRIHVTVDTRFQLSPLTRQLLRTLTNEVHVVVFFEPDPQATLYSAVKSLITEYQMASPMVKVEFVDYRVSPARALQIRDKYRLDNTENPDVVIFEANGRHRIVYEHELSEYDLSGIMEGQPARRSIFKGEQFFTSAIIGVSENAPVRAYYVEGHGEHDPRSEDGTQGYAGFAQLLQEKNIDLHAINLATNQLPADCQLLVLAGPSYPVPAVELDQVRAYLAGGGRALVLLSNPLRPNVRKSGLETLLAEWSVIVGDDVVVDQAQSRSAAAEVLFTSQFGNHPVVRPLHRGRLSMVTPRSVRPRGNDARSDGIQVDPLVFTSPEGRIVSSADGRGQPGTNGVVALAAAVEKGTISGVGPDRGSTRLVVVGESIFLANTLLGWEANRDFASLSVNWLLDRGQLLELGPRPFNEYRVSLTRAQMHAIRWLLLAVFPGSVMLMGVLIWAKRRN